MLQVFLFQVPPIGQFSNARRTPRSAAYAPSSPKTALYPGMAASTLSPSRAPAKVQTRSVPNRCALSMHFLRFSLCSSYWMGLQYRPSAVIFCPVGAMRSSTRGARSRISTP